MIKICFVDDEPLTVEWLTKTVNWKYFGIEVCGFASDGRKGMELILRERPNIVITDVKMPIMDGLTMIEQLEKDNITSKFIVLSGYEEFEYARKAIQFGVKEYLLKPFTNQKLEEVLRNVLKEIHDEQKQNMEIKKLQNESIQIKNEMRRYLYEKVIQEIPVTSDQIKLYQSTWSHTEQTMYQIILLNSVSVSVKNIVMTQLNKLFGRSLDAVVLELHKKECIIVFSYNRTSTVDIILEKKIENFVKLVCGQAKEVLNLTLRVGISEWIAGVQNLRSCYFQAKNASEFSYAMKKQNILRIQDVVINRECSINIQDYKIKFQKAIIQDARQDMEKLLRELWKEICILDEKPLSGLKKICSELCFSGFRMLEDMGGAIEKEFGDAYNPVVQIYRAESLEEMHTIMMENGEKMMDYIRKNDHIQSSRIVQKTLLYVKNNFQSDISAEVLAEFLKVTPGYFSTVFKREYGQAFMEYVTEVRITAAKRYLENNDLKISTVSNKVGYQDPKYFSTVFKKVVGVSPNEYRRIKSQKNQT